MAPWCLTRETFGINIVCWLTQRHPATDTRIGQVTGKRFGRVQMRSFSEDCPRTCSQAQRSR
jgi:hypothetical protein